MKTGRVIEGITEVEVRLDCQQGAQAWKQITRSHTEEETSDRGGRLNLGNKKCNACDKITVTKP